MSSFHGIPPNPTIYIKNINDKLKKDALRKNLYLAFSQFGNILEVHALKTMKLRGQAWIVFDNLGGATKAMRAGQDMEFFGKSLELSYAKKKSDTIAKMDGTYKPKRRDKKTNLAKALEKQAKKTPSAPPTKKITTLAIENKTAANRITRKEVVDDSPTNRILFVENLPQACSTMMLAILFQQYAGYKEARLVNGKPGIAFVEFESKEQAASAKESLQNFKITPTNHMKITFARQ